MSQAELRASVAQPVYVQRDAERSIVSVSLLADATHAEAVLPDSAELAEFARRIASAQTPMDASDLGLARVLEDLIDLLIAKQVFCFTDLPAAARSKLLMRRSLRGEIRSLDLLGDDNDVI